MIIVKKNKIIIRKKNMKEFITIDINSFCIFNNFIYYIIFFDCNYFIYKQVI